MAAYTDQALLTELNALGVIDPNILTEAFTTAQTTGQPFEEILLSRELITDDQLGKIVADLLSVPIVRLSERTIPLSVLKLVPERFARSQRIIAYEQQNATLCVASSNPKPRLAFEFIAKKVGLPIKLAYATNQDIEEALGLYAPELAEVFDDLIKNKLTSAGMGTEVEPPIKQLIDTILYFAYEYRASDIHLEPGESETVVRFRVDGLLTDMVMLPSAFHAQLVSRLKVLAHLRTDEHQAAQDGKFQWHGQVQDSTLSVVALETEPLDLRVSIVPVTEGEKVVMRLLAERSRQFSLHDLGLSSHAIAQVEAAYSRPYGMILTTGPTGSGKTTTLYAILKKLNARTVNIMTIEDPVEYDLEGVNQIQVNSKTNLTFAAGLRSIVRQDPDIILVGEIRDEDTADIAINAAMTGHLVLSSLHTNDAATSIPRLLELGVEPFLIASTVNVVIAQRLARKVCQKCRVSQTLTADQLVEKLTISGQTPLTPEIKTFLASRIGKRQKIRLYSGKGCALCHRSGFHGRIGIYEVLVLDETIRQAIIAKQDAFAIQDLARTAQMQTMLEDGIDKVLEGVTTVEEVLRVTKE